jgi:hypothetical protein
MDDVAMPRSIESPMPYIPRAARKEQASLEVANGTHVEVTPDVSYDKLKKLISSDRTIAERIIHAKDESMKRWMCDFKTWHRVGPIETTVEGRVTHTHGLKFLRLGKFDTHAKEISGNPFESMFIACLYKDGEQASPTFITDRFDLYSVNLAHKFYHQIKDIYDPVDGLGQSLQTVMLHWYDNQYRAY